MNLEVEHLTAGYEGTPVVRDVSLSVDDGEIVGVMGRNGVGKTTLLKSIMGLLEPQSGAVRIGGEPVAGPGVEDDRLLDAVAERVPVDAGSVRPDGDVLPDRLGRGLHAARERVVGDGSGSGGTAAVDRAGMGVGYVPQGRDVFPGLTVEQNLRLGEGVGKSDATAYERVYEYFPILEERADQDAGTLSGGQQQMLAIGRALVGVPDLLLVDEPSEGIQPSIVESITEDLGRINAEIGTTVLFVEQNLSVVQGLADRCYAMDKGRIVDELEGEEIQDRERLADHLAV